MQTITNKWIICRICLKTSEGAMLPIFGDEGSASQLPAEIADYGLITLTDTQSCPNRICQGCLLLLKAAKKFRKLCQTSAKQWQELMDKCNVKSTTVTKNDETSETCSEQLTTEFLNTESEKSLEMLDEPDGDVEKSTGIGYVFEVMENDEDECDEVAEESLLPHDAQFIELEDDDGGMNFLEDNSTGNSIELTYYSNTQCEDSNNEEIFGSEPQSNNSKLFDYEQPETENQSEVVVPEEGCDLESSSGIVKHKVTKRSIAVRRKNQRNKTKGSEDTQTEWTKKDTTTYVCSYCNNCYKEKAKLTLHLKVHTKEKPHECEICHKRFAQTPQLARHMNSHTGNRPFVCKFCHSSFADPSTCIKHQRIHTQERPYVCETCGKGFSYSNVLKVHVMSHTGEKPYSCKYCDKKFTQSHHRRTHERTHQ